MKTWFHPSLTQTSWFDPELSVQGWFDSSFVGSRQWTVLDTVGAAANSYSDTTAEPGAAYTYRIIAINEAGDTPSNTDEETTPGGEALGASPDAYGVMGIAASLVAAAALTAALGSVAVTGAEASTGTGYTLAVDAGAYAVAGSAADAPSDYTFVADDAGYSLSGVTASVLAAYVATLDSATYSATGSGATLQSPTALALTVELREGATVIASRALEPDTFETFVETLTQQERDAITDWSNLRVALIANGDTTDVSWVALRTPLPTLELIAEPSAHVITGRTAPSQHSLSDSIDAGAYATSGVAIGTLLELAETLEAAAAYGVVGADAGLTSAQSFTASAGAYGVTGRAVVDVLSTPPQVTFIGAFGNAQSNVQSINVTLTSTAQVGDLAVVAVSHRLGVNGTITGAAGWTPLAEQENSGTLHGTRLFAKVLQAGDIGPHVFNFNTGTNTKGTVLALVARGNGIALSAHAHQTNSSQANIPIPGLTTIPQGMLLLAYATKAHNATHDDLTGWTTAGTQVTTGGAANSNARVSGRHRLFSDANPSGLTVVSATSAVSTGHQVAITAEARLIAERGGYEIDGHDVAFENNAISTESDAYGVSGVAVDLVVAYAESSSAESYAVGGAATEFEFTAPEAFDVVHDPGTYTSTGRAAALTSSTAASQVIATPRDAGTGALVSVDAGVGIFIQVQSGVAIAPHAAAGVDAIPDVVSGTSLRSAAAGTDALVTVESGLEDVI